MEADMKNSSTTINWIAGAAAVYFIGSAIAGAIKRRKATNGIGATKQPRRIWAELEAAQNAGIDLNDPEGYKGHADVLRRMANGKIKDNGIKPIEERYFGQLRRAYKSVAGTTLRPDQSIVYNEYGDPIIIYNDYHLKELPQTAAQWLLNESDANITNPEQAAYWITIASIATGTKFVWARKGEHRGVQQLVFGANAPTERKQRISYLASPEKGGVYPEAFAHKIWERMDRNADDQEITNGVLQALRDTTSVGQAQKICVDQYMAAHQVKEPTVFQDLPF